MTHRERFEQWASSEVGKKFFRSKIGRYQSREWIEDQYRLMCDWLDDSPVKGNKRNWSQFAGNWLRREYRWRKLEIEKSLNPGTMTAAQEHEYYRKKEQDAQSRTSSDFEQLGG